MISMNCFIDTEQYLGWDEAVVDMTLGEKAILTITG